MKRRKTRLSAEQVEKLKTFSNISLALIGIAGTITLAVLAPNMFVAIDKIFVSKKKYLRFSSPESKEKAITKNFYYLRRKGYIRMRITKGDIVISLTRRGKKRLKKLNFQTLSVQSPKKWNGKWWQIAADIPTKKHKQDGDMLRKKLKTMNFFPLQRTLWIYPHDPRDEVDYISRYFGIANFVTVMEINRLDRDDEEKLLKYFKKQKIINQT